MKDKGGQYRNFRVVKMTGKDITFVPIEIAKGNTTDFLAKRARSLQKADAKFVTVSPIGVLRYKN